MKGFRILYFIALFIFIGFNSFAQETKWENNQQAVQLVNENQSFMKSIDNVNRPIDAFSINLTATENGKHYVSVKGNSERSPLNFFGSDAFTAFDALSENTQNLQSDFLNLNSEMKKMYEEMQASQQRFQELFKSFQDEFDKNSDDLKNNTETKSENKLK